MAKRVLYLGYIYHYYRRNKDGTRRYWRCEKRRECHTGLTTTSECPMRVLRHETHRHQHGPSTGHSETQTRCTPLILGRKGKAAQETAAPAVAAPELQLLDDEETQPVERKASSRKPSNHQKPVKGGGTKVSSKVSEQVSTNGRARRRRVRGTKLPQTAGSNLTSGDAAFSSNHSGDSRKLDEECKDVMHLGSLSRKPDSMVKKRVRKRVAFCDGLCAVLCDLCGGLIKSKDILHHRSQCTASRSDDDKLPRNVLSLTCPICKRSIRKSGKSTSTIRPNADPFSTKHCIKNNSDHVKCPFCRARIPSENPSPHLAAEHPVEAGLHVCCSCGHLHLSKSVLELVTHHAMEYKPDAELGTVCQSCGCLFGNPTDLTDHVDSDHMELVPLMKAIELFRLARKPATAKTLYSPQHDEDHKSLPKRAEADSGKDSVAE